MHIHKQAGINVLYIGIILKALTTFLGYINLFQKKPHPPL